MPRAGDSRGARALLVLPPALSRYGLRTLPHTYGMVGRLVRSRAWVLRSHPIAQKPSRALLRPSIVDRARRGRRGSRRASRWSRDFADERMSGGPQPAHLGVALFDMAGLVRIALLI